MDGSEPGDITPAAVLSGAPIDLQARTVRCVSSKCCIRVLLTNAVSISHLNPQHNLVPGEASHGSWIGTLFPKVIDGRIH